MRPPHAAPRCRRPRGSSQARNTGFTRATHLLALLIATTTALLVFALPALHEPPPAQKEIAPAYEAISGAAPPATDAAAAAIDAALKSSDLDNGDDPAAAIAAIEAAARWRTTEVRPADTLSAIFERLQIDPGTLQAVLDADPQQTDALQRIFPGQRLRLRLDADGALQELVFEADPSSGLHWQRAEDDDGFEVSRYEHRVEPRIVHASGVISDSLYQSATAAGLSDALIVELARIFGYDIDFALDIRPGDTFTVLYEEEYVRGEKIGDGAILAAEFSNHGRTFSAVRYTGLDGRADWYDRDGRPLRKAFLRSPVDFRRISSHFQRERFHPVLGVRRPHRGVDYAAATGTPIWASGDGRVEFAGWRSGYGNVVILRHGRHYETLYGHMSRIAKLTAGARVKQGQIIGYVGQTGLASGPHLHYEFRIDGRHVDPVNAEIPRAEPIPPELRRDFARETGPLLARLDVVNSRFLAEVRSSSVEERTAATP
ncbi:peptidoglycan DD-metalloendopeptidase family protein [Plasticicumulans acidivorans]|uniref:Murein DD-endopeptidase MepM/ murein hydrolase activator NlpD n=1 Tax=Plasticicumulans acidivorans TaxID=886464 RepID=A0A317MZZ0_9GAMM|nr:peptidoglycan DD-metalloendopeptidase family protein [Plasticicumulans acidivorans]PWV65891.1 murein DD-endopeptidase MepM/ murein hydrolase activator NlpD [Plasticicumulans acidivorans]